MSDQDVQSQSFKSSTLWTIRGKQSWNKLGTGLYKANGGIWVRYIIEDCDQYQPPKLAISISKKYGNAVQRNRLKRRVKEVFRSLSSEKQIPSGLNILVGVSKTVNSELNYQQIKQSLSEIMKVISLDGKPRS